MSQEMPPMGVSLATDVEYLAGRPSPYRARVRWIDPGTKLRKSKSECAETPESAQAWIDAMVRAARGGVDPRAATMTLAEYGNAVMTLALRGLEAKTLDPYLAGWRRRVVPTLGHLPVRMITNGAVDRVVHGWIADECSRSTVKSSLAILVRVMEQAVRDGIVDRNPARVTGWQRDYQRAEDELDDPLFLAVVRLHYNRIFAPVRQPQAELGVHERPVPWRAFPRPFRSVAQLLDQADLAQVTPATDHWQERTRTTSIST